MKKNKKNSSTDEIKYVGQVSIQVRKNNKVVGKKIIHNTGNLQLFNFLSKCLEGNWSVATNLRPKFIKLFTVTTVGANPDAIPNINYFSDLFAGSVASTELKSLSYQLYSSNLTSTLDADKTSSTTLYKFVVPFTQLADYERLNMLAIYSQEYVNSDLDASAYILIKDANGTELSDILSEVGLNQFNESDANQYNLLIEWKMTFKN